MKQRALDGSLHWMMAPLQLTFDYTIWKFTNTNGFALSLIGLKHVDKMKSFEKQGWGEYWTYLYTSTGVSVLQ